LLIPCPDRRPNGRRAGILPSAGYNDHHNGEGAAVAEYTTFPDLAWERDTSIAEPVEPETGLTPDRQPSAGVVFRAHRAAFD
jgi:hypothetical protein